MGWFTKNTEVVCTELEEGAVLLNLETRLYYSLDGTSLEVWNLIDSTANIEDLVDQLMANHEAGDEDPKSLVSKFLERLRSEGLMVPSEEKEGEVRQPLRTRSQSVGKSGQKSPLAEPALLKHDEPLHEVPLHPFDPQLPLAE